MTDPDVLIVGGGIAGGTLATVLARAGLSTVVLERQAVYRDRVRGECMWQWGVAEMRRLGLADVMDRAGARSAQRLATYDELTGPDAPDREDLGRAVAGVAGTMNLYHPTATEALVEAAAAAGGTFIPGVADVRVKPGSPPVVEWSDAGGSHRISPRLVVGADGRASTVRGQIGAELVRDPVAHLVAGLRVEGIDGVDEDTNVLARERDLLFFSFPQGGGRARLYFAMPAGQRDRFEGAGAATRFLAAVGGLTSVPDPGRWGAARPAGPCATFQAEDAWADRATAPGVVLIGDAAGYNNPLTGQGQSLAVRDAGALADVLLMNPTWDTEALESYAAVRAERLRRARVACLVEVWANDGFEVQDAEERRRRYGRAFADPILGRLLAGEEVGYDTMDRTPTDTEARERLFATA